MAEKITVNGQVYDDWSQVPPELRTDLAGLPDADGNGVPDIFEGNLAGLVDKAGTGVPQNYTTTTSSTSIEIDGKHYDSLDQVPQPMRDLIAKSMTGTAGSGAASTEPTTGPTSLSMPAPTSATPAPVAPSQPQPGQVLLNGEQVTVEQAAGVSDKKGFFSRLFGR